MKKIAIMMMIVFLLTACTTEPTSNVVNETVDEYELLEIQERKITKLSSALDGLIKKKLDGQIDDNFEELKARLTRNREKYMGIIKDAQNDESTDLSETVGKHALMTQAFIEAINNREDSSSKEESLLDLYKALNNHYEEKIEDLVGVNKTIALKPIEKNRLEDVEALTERLIFNDPYLKYQWGVYDIGMPFMWHQDLVAEKTVKIAVIDTGIDYTHEDLVGRVNQSLGYDFVNDDDDPLDDNGHGTHVAGIIGATANNGVGISGIMGTLPVELIPIKVLDENGEGEIEDIIKGIEHSIEKDVDIINLSVGAYLIDEDLRDVLLKARDNDIVVVTAAGNENIKTNYSTLTRNEVSFTVAATNPKHEKAPFSNYGRFVDIAAPGTQIVSTVLNNSYEAWDGTSMAAPIVTGVIGNLLATQKDISPMMIQEVVSRTAESLDENSSLDSGVVSMKKISIFLNKR